MWKCPPVSIKRPPMLGTANVKAKFMAVYINPLCLDMGRICILHFLQCLLCVRTRTFRQRLKQISDNKTLYVCMAHT